MILLIIIFIMVVQHQKVICIILKYTITIIISKILILVCFQDGLYFRIFLNIWIFLCIGLFILFEFAAFGISTLLWDHIFGTVGMGPLWKLSFIIYGIFDFLFSVNSFLEKIVTKDIKWWLFMIVFVVLSVSFCNISCCLLFLLKSINKIFISVKLLDEKLFTFYTQLLYIFFLIFIFRFTMCFWCLLLV